MKTVYITSDDRQFHSLSDAKDHEDFLKLVDAVFKKITKIPTYGTAIAEMLEGDDFDSRAAARVKLKKMVSTVLEGIVMTAAAEPVVKLMKDFLADTEPVIEN